MEKMLLGRVSWRQDDDGQSFDVAQLIKVYSSQTNYYKPNDADFLNFDGDDIIKYH